MDVSESEGLYSNFTILPRCLGVTKYFIEITLMTNKTSQRFPQPLFTISCTIHCCKAWIIFFKILLTLDYAYLNISGLKYASHVFEHIFGAHSLRVRATDVSCDYFADLDGIHHSD